MFYGYLGSLELCIRCA